MKNKRIQSAEYEAVIEVPFGAVGITVQGLHITVDLLPQGQAKKVSNNKLALQVSTQIEAYLKNGHSLFNVPMMLKGTQFQRDVWLAIAAIPSGQVLTYSEIAAQLKSSPRAVANACGANHLPIIIPCHRVVAKKGLGGFMQNAEHGLKIKTWLLQHEGAINASGQLV